MPTLPHRAAPQRAARHRASSRRPRVRRTLPAAAAAAAALLLSGCTTNPGAAAVVGGQSISDATLQAAVRSALTDPAIAQQVGANLATFTRRELSIRIQLLLFRAAAAREGITVTPTQVNNQLQQYIQQAGSRQALEQGAAQQGVAPIDLTLNIEEQLLVDALARHAGLTDTTSVAGQQRVSQLAVQVLRQEAARLGVRVDPRYGRWNPATAGVTPVNFGIARPAA